MIVKNSVRLPHNLSQQQQLRNEKREAQVDRQRADADAMDQDLPHAREQEVIGQRCHVRSGEGLQECELQADAIQKCNLHSLMFKYANVRSRALLVRTTMPKTLQQEHETNTHYAAEKTNSR